MPTSLYLRSSELIRRGSFVEAFDALRDEPAGSDVDELRSLLGRLLGQVSPREVDALTSHHAPHAARAADSGPSGVPWVPRQTLSSPHPVFSSDSFPQIVEETCFVTAATSDYLPLLLGCLGSITACSRFARARIVVFDCGLATLERDVLERASPRLQIVPLMARQWFWRDVCDGNGRLASIFCRGFLRELIADVQYYFWIDADAWIQDEGGVAEYLTVAMSQGISVAEHPFGRSVSRDSHWIRRGTLTESQVACVVGQKALIACCFCVDASSDSYATFCATLRQNLSAIGAKWGMDQEVLLYITASMGLTLLPNEYAFEGAPLLRLDAAWNHLLYVDVDRPIQIYHVGGGLKQAHRKRETVVECHHRLGTGKTIQLTTSNRYYVPAKGDVAALTQRIIECCL